MDDFNINVEEFDVGHEHLKSAIKTLSELSNVELNAQSLDSYNRANFDSLKSCIFELSSNLINLNSGENGIEAFMLQMALLMPTNSYFAANYASSRLNQFGSYVEAYNNEEINDEQFSLIYNTFIKELLSMGYISHSLVDDYSQFRDINLLEMNFDFSNADESQIAALQFLYNCYGNIYYNGVYEYLIDDGTGNVSEHETMFGVDAESYLDMVNDQIMDQYGDRGYTSLEDFRFKEGYFFKENVIRNLKDIDCEAIEYIYEVEHDNDSIFCIDNEESSIFWRYITSDTTLGDAVTQDEFTIFLNSLSEEEQIEAITIASKYSYLSRHYYDDGELMTELNDYILNGEKYFEVVTADHIVNPLLDSKLGEYYSNKNDELRLSTQGDPAEALSLLWEIPVSFATGFVSGVLSVGEDLIDGAFMLGSAVYSGASYLWADDAYREKVQGWVGNFVGENWMQDAYFETTSYFGIDNEIAGDVYSLSSLAGSFAGYAILGSLTGGAGFWIDASVAGLASAGNASEIAFQNGASYWNAAAYGGINGLAGIGSQYFATNISSNYSSSLLRALSIGGVKFVEETVNQVSAYYFYGDDDDTLWSYLGDNSLNLVMAFAGGMAQSYMTGDKLYDKKHPSDLPDDDYWKNIKESDNLFDDFADEAAALGEVVTPYGTYAKTNMLYRAQREKYRNLAIDYYHSLCTPDGDLKWMTDEQFYDKLKKVDAMAAKLEHDGVMHEEDFYRIWGTSKGSRPDPSTYLSNEYIANHIKKFEADGAARLVDGGTYINRVAANGNGSTVGNPMSYDVSGKIYAGSEFMSTKSNIDDALTRAKTANDPYNSLISDLGLTDYEYWRYKNTGVMRYDVSAIASYNPRLPSGNEPGAFPMDWIPGGLTLGGSPELVIDRFDLKDIGNMLSKIY